MRQLVAIVPGLMLLSGCGVSVRVGTTTSTSPVRTPTGEETFSARGMALHFSYPAAFSQGTIKSVGRKLESDKNVTRAALAVGGGGYDLLIVTRYARIRPRVSAKNIRSQKAAYDRGLTKIFGRPMAASVGTLGGLPAFFYRDAPTPGVPVQATTRARFVFVGPDEYELQCQWTSAERTAVMSACGEMLRTVHA